MIQQTQSAPVRPELARHVCNGFCNHQEQIHAELEYMPFSVLQDNQEWVARSGPGIFPLYYQPPGETHVYRVVDITQIHGLPEPDLDRLIVRMRSKGIPDSVIAVWISDPLNREVVALYRFHTRYAYQRPEHIVAQGRGLPKISFQPEIVEEDEA